ncbi:MAG: carbon monoxide dehydrogenase [Alphaproteobacteria bacterium]|nr:carbon monoxide dehydrogenase [Alphaproteobacteria bacterium]
MKPPVFDYLRCESAAQALEALHQYGDDLRILAGGQSLIAMLNMRLVRPAVLADIMRVKELAGLETISRHAKRHLRIGAAVTQSRVLECISLASDVPLLAKALPFTGHVQTRNRGTVCGSLAHADPSSELPLVACVLDGQITLARTSGRRQVGARDFFTGLLETDRKSNELIESVEFPCASSGETFAFREAAMRHGDFAIIAIAVKATTEKIVIGVGGGASRPEVRSWPRLAGSALADALNQLAWELPLQDDALADARYRRHLVRELGQAAIGEACA